MTEKEKLNEILEYYGGLLDRQSQEQLVAMLREIQELFGFVPAWAKERAAEAAGVKVSTLDCIIRLYPSIKGADYRHTVTVCSGARCQAKGGEEILRAVKRELGITKGNLSADGRTYLKIQNCLKQCRTSPNLMIDGKLYSGVTAEQIPGLLGTL